MNELDIALVVIAAGFGLCVLVYVVAGVLRSKRETNAYNAIMREFNEDFRSRKEFSRGKVHPNTRR